MGLPDMAAELLSSHFAAQPVPRVLLPQVKCCRGELHVLRTPRPSTASCRSLAGRDAQGLHFRLRAPNPITHFCRYRLRDAGDRVAQFEVALLPFRRAKRLGPVLFQLPKTFTADLTVLDSFLHQWPRELRASFEFRDASWFNDAVYEILRRHGTALCLAEREETATPEVLTTDFVYLRLRKKAYSSAELHEIARRIERYARDREVFAFFRQTGDKGPAYAQEITRRVEAGV